MAEILIERSKSSGGRTNIPERLNGLKIGDLLIFRSKEEIEQDDSNGRIRGSWNKNGLQDWIFEKNPPIEFTIDSEMMSQINNEKLYFAELPDGDLRWKISLDMMQFKSKLEEKPKKERVDYANLDLEINNKDNDIIKEMISKVDKDQVKNLLRIGCKGFCPEESMINKLLNDWAKAKYEFYILFGKNLTVSDEIESEITADEIDRLIKENIYPKFSKYIPLLLAFRPEEFIENQIMERNANFEKHLPGIFSRGKKLTKFLHEYLGDKEFSDDMANILGTRKIKSKINISIAPYDFFTVSANSYGWTSCQSIGRTTSDFKNDRALLSYLLDNCSLVAYKYNGNDSMKFDYENYSIVGNSKSWRQMVYVDKKNSSSIFSRQYPRTIDVVTEKARYILEDVISKHFGVENIWVSRTFGIEESSSNGYVANTNLIYHDVMKCDSQLYKHVFHKNLNPKNRDKFVVGNNAYCLKCGKNLDHGYRFLCEDCQ